MCLSMDGCILCFSISDFYGIQYLMFNDPLGQPTVTAGRDNCFCTCCPSVLFKTSKTKQQKAMVTTDETVGLAEWIIDDTCLVLLVFVI